jgi:hypothetical protein
MTKKIPYYEFAVILNVCDEDTGEFYKPEHRILNCLDDTKENFSDCRSTKSMKYKQ